MDLVARNGVTVSVADDKADARVASGLFSASEASPSKKLTGKALDDRATELDIEGRSDMTADEKRAAIAAAEA